MHGGKNLLNPDHATIKIVGLRMRMGGGGVMGGCMRSNVSLILFLHVALSRSELKMGAPVNSFCQTRMMNGRTAACAIGFASPVGRLGVRVPTQTWRKQRGISQLVCKTKKSIARQREQVDKILEIFKDGGGSSLQHVHKELVHVPEVPWDELPKELDPHWVTFRGVKLESGLNWTRKKMMETLNPRSIRKRAQVESFYAALSLLKPEKGSTVVDFGSGSGNLVLPLAHLMPDLNFVAVDLKTEAIQILQNRSEAAGLRNCRAFNGYIEDFEESFDFALGLHVCGPASNAVMDSAVRSDAAFLLSPCCIGKLRTGAQPSVSLGPPGQGQQQREYPMSRWMGRRLNSETFELVAQAADRSEVPPVDADVVAKLTDDMVKTFERGAVCKTAVEFDRLEWARERGWGPYLLRMRGLDDYAKKDLLVAIPPGWEDDIRKTFEEGIRPWVTQSHAQPVKGFGL